MSNIDSEVKECVNDMVDTVVNNEPDNQDTCSYDSDKSYTDPDTDPDTGPDTDGNWSDSSL